MSNDNDYTYKYTINNLPFKVQKEIVAAREKALKKVPKAHRTSVTEAIDFVAEALDKAFEEMRKVENKRKERYWHARNLMAGVPISQAIEITNKASSGVNWQGCTKHHIAESYADEKGWSCSYNWKKWEKAMVDAQDKALEAKTDAAWRRRDKRNRREPV
jgi:hypothetical protein